MGLVALHRVAGIFGGRLSFLLGGAAAGHFASYDHWYTAQSKEGWIHLFGFLEPGLGWRADLPWGGLLWQELLVPVLGVAFRPEYQGLTRPPGPTWLGFGDIEGFDQGVHYVQPLGERIRLGLTYTFVGFRYQKPRPLAWTRHGLALYLTVWDGGFPW